MEDTGDLDTVKQQQQQFNKVNFEDEQKSLEQMIEKEPSNHAGYYRLHRLFQLQRRASSSIPGDHPPQTREIDLIQKAYSLAPNNPEVILAYCHSISDLIRTIKFTDSEHPGLIDFGSTKKFSGVLHAIRFLKQEANKILVLDPISLKYTLGIACMFSSNLPYRYRDNRFAKQCLERALIFNPRSSKAIVRRGLFALLIEKNTDTAQSYFEMACNANPNDFISVNSLLLIYFHNRLENQATVKRILTRVLSSDGWDDDELANFYFLKGLHALMSDWNEAAGAWVKAYELSEQVLSQCFEKVSAMKKKFRWPDVYDKILCLPTFCKQLKELLKNLPEEEQFVLKKVRMLIKDAGRKEETKNKETLKAKYTANIDGLDSKKPPPRIFYEDESHMTNEFENRQEAYRILGVKDNASINVVQDTYRKIVFAYHPAMNEGLSKEQREENFKTLREVNWAFSVLI